MSEEDDVLKDDLLGEDPLKGEVPEYSEDDDLYASYDAFKALINAGLSRREAMERTGMDEETLQLMEQEDDVIDFKNDAKEVWDDEENMAFDEKFMNSDDVTDDGDGMDDGSSEDYGDDYGSGGGGGGRGWDDIE